MPARAGFTMVEIMFSVLVLGILIGLLIVGARSATKYVKKSADEQTVRNLAMAVKEFKREFGFAPPLVKEKVGAAGSPDRLPMRTMIGGGGAVIDETNADDYAISVYKLTVPADVLILQNNGVTPNATEPLEDERYSVRTLAVYLAGALNYRINSRLSQTDPNMVPLDGVQGPGFFKPRADGRFDVPTELRPPVSATPSKRGIPYESMVNLGGSAIKLYNGNLPEIVALADRNNVPIRYYRWEPNPAITDILLKLSVPAMVGRVGTGFALPTPAARDLSANAELRSASWAIVAAGANKVFGDEPIAELRSALSMPGESDEKVRQEAEEDNIVEVGQ
jgi:type II secretory pathway pseudopilin PulG